MALPVTITGLQAATSTLTATRPFISSGGNVYVIGRETTTLAAYKATDPTDSFTNVGTDVSLSSILHVNAVQVGDVLHVVTSSGTAATSVTYQYHTFNMATDTWDISNESIASAVDVSDVFGTAAVFVSIGVRSDGDVIVLRHGTDERIMGTGYSRVVYDRREGGIWTNAVAIDPGGEVTYIPIDLVMGSSDRAHFFFANGTNTRHISLSSANALGSVTLNIVNSITSTATAVGQLGAFYVSGSDTKISLARPDNTANQATGTIAVSEENPSTNNTDDITGTTNTLVGAHVHSLAADDTTLWHTFIASDGDIFTQSNEDEAGWSTPEEFYDDATAVEHLKTNIYERGGATVLAMVLEVGSDIKYHEKELSAGAAETDFDMDAAATLTMSGESTATSALDSDAAATLTWDGASQATVSADWSSDAIASVTFNGAAVAASDLDSDAVALLTWNGVQINVVEAAWDSDAAATVTFTGVAITSAAFDSDAVATVTFNGIATAASDFDSDALAVLTWNSESTATADLDSDAAATLTLNGAAVSATDWSAASTADLQWVGEAQTLATAAWNATATGTLTMAGESEASSVLSSTATAVLTKNGSAFADSDWSSDAVASLTWIAEEGTGEWDSDVTATITFSGVGLLSGDWSATGTATLTFSSSELVSADWSAAAAATLTVSGEATAAGAFDADALATLTATGVSTASAAWSSAASAVLTMAGVEVAAATWTVAAVATSAFTGQEIGETSQFDVNAAASLSWGGVDATPGVVDLNGWRIKARLARESDAQDEEDIMLILTALHYYQELNNDYY